MSSAKSSLPFPKEKTQRFSSENFLLAGLCKTLLISSLFILALFFFMFNNDPSCSATRFFVSTSNSLGIINPSSSSSSNNYSTQPAPKNHTSPSPSPSPSPTTLKHIAFGLQSCVATCRFRKHYIEAWWRPNITRGYVYLEENPNGTDLLPWSNKSPPLRINDDLTHILGDAKPRDPVTPRMVHGILELFREEHKGLRWLIMGDDDTIFFFDNIVDVLSKYDHTKYYYIGHQSEFVMSNYFFNFRQAYGGGGFILSYPLAKALVKDMDRCLKTYYNLPADTMTMTCLQDLGVSLTQNEGAHQIDLRGDISGFLSVHPKELILSLHHVDTVDPYFPRMNRSQSVKHLMKAADADQSRLFQQTICYHREKRWSFSISWGYTTHIYENVLARSFLQTPIETFWKWIESPKEPHYMFNTRMPSNNPCDAPHVFYFKSLQKNVSTNQIKTIYTRFWRRRLPACANNSADYISTIHVITPAVRRTELQRCECCDIVGLEDSGKAEVKFRECMTDEIVA